MVFSLVFFLIFTEVNKRNASYNFIIKGDVIYQVDDGQEDVFIPNGVTLSATQPGVIPSGNKVSKATYIEWFGLMQEMGLNTVQVDALMPSKFYNALKSYNEKVQKPLYLVQGIYFDEVALKDGFSPLEDKWQNEFQEDIEAAIDAVHGNSKIFDSIYLFKAETVDVSDYILGYTLGVNWNADDISYANAIYDEDSFRGTYFLSAEDASSFEIFLCEMLEHAATYEVTNYGQQSLYSVHAHGGRLAQALINGDTLVVPYDMIRHYPVIDVEHIVPSKDLKSGFYVNYDIEQVDYELRDFSKDEVDNTYFNGLAYLLDYHQLPVVISAYGYPSTRFASQYNKLEPVPYIDEKAQGDRTVEQYQYIREMGLAGQFLRDWQDAWFKSSWYSYNLKVLDHSVLWRDVQTYAQGYGMVAFDYSGDIVHQLDSSKEEWTKVEPLIEGKDHTYKINHDVSAINLLIQSEGPLEDKSAYYIGFDVTPNSGSHKVAGLDVTFQRPVDFVAVLDLDGVQELLVHSYYDVNKFRLSRDMLRRYPDMEIPISDSPVFNSIYQYSDENALYFKFKELDDDDIRLTGSLIMGNNNPSSDHYLSVADWNHGDDFIELRLPYGLLNFMSPASKIVMDDFYGDHIVGFQLIEGIHVEFCENDGESSYVTEPYYYTWLPWSNPTFEMRLKPVYYALKEVMEVN